MEVNEIKLIMIKDYKKPEIPIANKFLVMDLKFI